MSKHVSRYYTENVAGNRKQPDRWDIFDRSDSSDVPVASAMTAELANKIVSYLNASFS